VKKTFVQLLLPMLEKRAVEELKEIERVVCIEKPARYRI
jgi:hypothetical protein